MKDQILEGSADNLIWDRLDDMDPMEIQRTFREPIGNTIGEGVFDDEVRARAKELGLVEVETP